MNILIWSNSHFQHTFSPKDKLKKTSTLYLCACVYTACLADRKIEQNTSSALTQMTKSNNDIQKVLLYQGVWDFIKGSKDHRNLMLFLCKTFILFKNFSSIHVSHFINYVHYDSICRSHLWSALHATRHGTSVTVLNF